MGALNNMESGQAKILWSTVQIISKVSEGLSLTFPEVPKLFPYLGHSLDLSKSLLLI